MSRLFEPLKVGNAQLSNRIAMAPLTRFRADDAHVPLPFVKDYYTQRASYPGTQLITEATFIAPKAGGFANAPGIYNQDQINAWKEVTDAVHKNGSSIFLQLWALGRAANPANLKKELGEDAKVVSASNIPFEGGATPVGLSEDEILEYIQLYKQGAINAIEAGFDGVEIHGANGYLIDQFTQDVSNDRTDSWGGSIENRSRFAIEITKAVVGAIGPEKTGIRLSPFSPFQGMKMKDPNPQFAHLVTELRKLKLAYLHLVESRVAGNETVGAKEAIDFLTDIWDNQSPVLIAGGFSPESGKEEAQRQKNRDIVIVYGRHFIPNPDLVFRIKENVELTPYDREKFYNAKEKSGYIDYPYSEEFKKSEYYKDAIKI